MTPISIAVVGTGRIGTDYLDVIEAQPGFQLAAVVDRRREVAVAAGERWGCAQYEDVEQLLASAPPDAVLVATPPSDHEATTIAALEAGAHVLCEKPLALSLASGRRMLDVAARQGRLLSMSAKFRHANDVIEAKARIEAGAIGEVVSAENWFRSAVDMSERWNSDPARSGGGVLIDNGTHSIDLLRYLFGPISWVAAAETRRVQAIAVEDGAVLLAGHDSGAVSGASLSWSVASDEQWYLVAHGTTGTVRLGWTESSIRTRGNRAQAFGTGYSKRLALGRQLHHFGGVIRGQVEPVMGDDDILSSIAAIEAAYRSLAADGARMAVRACNRDSDPG